MMRPWHPIRAAFCVHSHYRCVPAVPLRFTGTSANAKNLLTSLQKPNEVAMTYTKACERANISSVEELLPIVQQLYAEKKLYHYNTGRYKVIITKPDEAVQKLKMLLSGQSLRQGTLAVVDVLREKQAKLDELAAVHSKLDASAVRFANLFRKFIIIFFTLQFLILFNCVFVIFDWNLVEPITFFIGFTMVLLGLYLFAYFRRDYTQMDLIHAVKHWQLDRSIRKSGFPERDFLKLREEVDSANLIISRNRNLLR